MQINISFPSSDNYSGTEEVKSFLRQLELSVHHAQKAFKEIVEMEKEKGNDSPDINCSYRLRGVYDTSTGDKFESDFPSASVVEIELYS